jgi:hypothetical protein
VASTPTSVASSVGSLGMPSLQQRVPSKTMMGMVMAGVVGRASKAAAARLLMLWRGEREIWLARVEAACVASRTCTVLVALR